MSFLHLFQYIIIITFPRDEVPDIEAIFDKQLKAIESSNSKTDLFTHKKVKDFDSKMWKVHHEGKPMPKEGEDTADDEDADLIMSQVSHIYSFQKPLSQLTVQLPIP